MMINELWRGADFKLADNSDAKIYCFLDYNNRYNECIAAAINFDEAEVKINTITSFAFNTEVIYLPRGERND